MSAMWAKMMRPLGNSYSDAVAEMAAEQGNSHVVISAQIEEEISQLDDEEAVDVPQRNGT